METDPTVATETGERPAFIVRRPPVSTTPLVFCSPHSGSAYPASFLKQSKLPPHLIRRSEDLFVDELYGFATALGAPMIAVQFPRAFLDVNREPYELDPAMFDAPLPDHANSRSIRVAGGLGTIPRIVAENTEIYAGPVSLEEGLGRVRTYHLSFHKALEALIAETKRQFGIAILIDCHSMPSSVRTKPGGRNADIVVGDRFGTSAAGGLVAFLSACFAHQGYEVLRNKPYAGGYITERYGRPSIGEHAIQIEISRALYAEETEFVPSADFSRVKRDLEAIFASFAQMIEDTYTGSIAAE